MKRNSVWVEQNSTKKKAMTRKWMNKKDTKNGNSHRAHHLKAKIEKRLKRKCFQVNMRNPNFLKKRV